MKLHISYNFADLSLALAVAEQTAHLADEIYLGSLLLMSHGKDALLAFKEKYPNKPLALDTKMSDNWNANVAFFSSFDINQLSVIAGVKNFFIQQLTAAAHAKQIKVALDLVANPAPEQAVFDAHSLDIDNIIYRSALRDAQDISPLEAWSNIRGNTKLPILLDGTNISFENCHLIKEMSPHGVIVGSFITQASNPVETAEKLKEILNN